ncbi:MAG TPA: LLM class flavin-dependent oxidoreductase [Anaerolineae bacterium]|nr:LLM class flavin-dependent oxidoreductase [Anaerolineae bacterium]
MKFQVCYLPGAIPETIRLAQLVEDLGYDCVWLPDQTFHRDPFVALAAIAGATQRIQLGLGVTTPYARHPVQIARAIATVDEMSEGRAILGLGAGNKKMFLDKLGMPQDRAAARIRETVSIIRKLLAGETVSWSSADLTLQDVKMEFPARADLPIYIASRAPLMLSVGGEVADGVIAEALFTPESIQYFLERVERGAREAERDSASIETVCWQVVQVTDDRERGVEGLRSWAAHIIGASSDEIVERLGIAPDVSAAIHAAYREGGQNAAAQYVGAREVDAVAIVGPPEHCAEKIQRIAAEGIGAVTLLVRGTTADKEDTLKRLAAQVLSQLEPIRV